MTIRHGVLQETYPDPSEFNQKLVSLPIFFRNPREPTTNARLTKPVFRRLALLFPEVVADLRAHPGSQLDPYNLAFFAEGKRFQLQLQPVTYMMARLVDADDPGVRRPDITNPGTMILDTIHIYR